MAALDCDVRSCMPAVTQWSCTLLYSSLCNVLRAHWRKALSEWLFPNASPMGDDMSGPNLAACEFGCRSWLDRGQHSDAKPESIAEVLFLDSRPHYLSNPEISQKPPYSDTVYFLAIIYVFVFFRPWSGSTSSKPQEHPSHGRALY